MMQTEMELLPSIPRFRSTDPDTSMEAAEASGDLRRRHYLQISAALALHPEGGTIYEIAEWCGLDHFQVARRMPEEKSLFVVVMDADGKPVTKKTPSGRSGRIWRKA